MNIRTIVPQGVPKALGPYSVCKVFNNLGYISGQIPIDPETGQLVSSTIQEQTERIMKNLDIILKYMNIPFENILKCTIYLVSMDNFQKVNGVYGKYFTKDPPARVCVAVHQLPKNCRVQIDAIVAVPQ